MATQHDVIQRKPRRLTLAAIVRMISHVAGLFAAVAVLLIMISTVVDVTRRQTIGGSVPGLVEMAESLLVAMVFLGLASREIRGGHVRVELVLQRLSPATRDAITALGYALVVVPLTSWMIWMTTARAIESFRAGERRYGLLELPLWPARWVISVGLTLLLLQATVSMATAIRSWYAQRRSQPATSA